jgi:signal transduction histidine kinase
MRLIFGLRIKTLTIIVVAVLAISAITTATSIYTINNHLSLINDRWGHFRSGPAEKQIIISNLRNALGFGGMIHNFKNFVLRQDRKLILEVESDIISISTLLTAYQNNGLNAQENVAIDTLSGRLTKYQNAISVAETMARDGKSSKEIDAAVRINDTLAIDAMVSLVDTLAAAYRDESKNIEATVASVNKLSGQFIALSITLALLSIGFTYWFMYRRVLHPMKSLGHSMEEISNKNTAHEIEATERKDEIADMARTVEIFRKVMEERRDFEFALVEAKNVAESSNAAKTEFLANMSHELRTPLNAILGFSDVIHEGAFGPIDNEVYAGYIDDIRHSGRTLLNLVENILDVSEIDAHSVTLDEQSVELCSLMETCLGEISGPARRKQISIANHMVGIEIAARVDPMRIRKVISNILSNAVKFTPNGGTLSVAAFFEVDGAISISITDSGIGMERGTAERAMSPFTQIDRGEYAKHEGLGLGLYVSRLLVEEHGGRLTIKSIPNGGTCVTIMLPKDRVADRAVPGEAV